MICSRDDDATTHHENVTLGVNLHEQVMEAGHGWLLEPILEAVATAEFANAAWVRWTLQPHGIEGIRYSVDGNVLTVNGPLLGLPFCASIRPQQRSPHDSAMFANARAILPLVVVTIRRDMDPRQPWIFIAESDLLEAAQAEAQP